MSFHPFNPDIVNVHISQWMRRKQKFRLHEVLEKSCGRDSDDVGMQIMKQTYESSKERLVGRDHFAFKIPAMGSKQLGNTQCMYM